MAAKLRDVGLGQTTLESFQAGDAEGTNVVARLPGRTDRLLIIATHHDSAAEDPDGSSRSRSLSLLIETGRQATLLQPNKTWILASFDGGASGGEGMAHYLNSLGESRRLVDGVILIEAAPADDPSSSPTLIAPACAGGESKPGRRIAGRDLVSAALSALPESARVSFDDPGIGLLTQPFIRAFRTACAPGAERALADGLGVIQVSDSSYSRSFLAEPAVTNTEVPSQDEGAARLGAIALSAIQGVDATTPFSPQSDSWLVVGRSVWPGWAVFGLGLLTLVPGLAALRAQRPRLLVRAGYSAVFTVVLFFEPELAVFAMGLPNLVTPWASRIVLTLTFVPLGLLGTAGLVGLMRGSVTGSWLSIWLWLGLLVCVALLYTAAGTSRKSGARSKRGKR